MKKITLVCLLLLLVKAVEAQIPSIDDSPQPRNIKLDTAKPSLIIVYNNVDQAPEFPGGLGGYTKFLTNNLKWPNGSNGITGRIFLSFVVERDGHLSNFKIERGLSRKLDAEAVRVLKLSPKWKPGIKNGYKVRVRYFVPVNVEYGKTKNRLL